ncbi:hypothetical protein NF681_21195 (plasmid) [Comamonadaceae bacterium OTU4NAUVB1]|nr:hypothetical protein NF681_21195 [Comamonadaceae bacterium OTU4NAUVB1]
MPSLEQQVCGFEGAHHPGHPVVIAVLIMTKYPSLSAAREREEGADCAVVLADGDIPGAGEQVGAALDILATLPREGPDAAFARATRQWHTRTARRFRDRQLPGQTQAERFKARFFELAARWPI